MDVEILKEQFGLYPQKAIFWRAQSTLLLSDLHLGKINHFRKAGIPVPSKANDHNLEILIDLIRACKPERIVCLGDLFHSHYNAEWEVFGEVVKHFSDIRFDLVVGNHDIMGRYQYKRKGIALHDALRIGDFLLTHHPLDQVPDGTYNIAGDGVVTTLIVGAFVLVLVVVVLLRVDLNVPVSEGMVSDTTRIERVASTITELSDEATVANNELRGHAPPG